MYVSIDRTSHIYDEVQSPETIEPVYSVVNTINNRQLQDVKMINNECYTIPQKNNSTQFEISYCSAYEL